MPTQPTYPGVYVQELPSGVRTLTGVATSVTAFVGYAPRGLDNRARRIFSYADFERAFGGLDAASELSYAVQHFFANGGSEAVVVRVPKNDNAADIAAAQQAADAAAAARQAADDALAGNPADAGLIAAATAAAAAKTAADKTLADKTAAGSSAAGVTLLDGSGGKPALAVTALSRGSWGNQVVVEVDYHDAVAKQKYADDRLFNLTISDLAEGTVEEFDRVTMDSAKANYVVAVVNDLDSGSKLVSLKVPDPTAGRPLETGTSSGDITLSGLKNDKDYSIKLTSDVPNGKITNLAVPVIAAGEALPTSVLGLCRFLERKINLAVKSVPGAAVRCEPGSTGKGIRVVADFSGDLGANDAQLTFAAGAPNDALAMLELEAPTATNVARYWLGKGRAVQAQARAAEGRDGTILPRTDDLIGKEADFTGIYALEKVDLFNLLAIPDATRAQAGNPAALDSTVSPNDVYAAAMTYCQKRRAFLLIDPPPQVDDVEAAVEWKSSGLTVHEKDGAAFFPRLRLADPMNDYQLRTFAPSGVVAGLFARTDANRGVWKAPAGTEATLTGVQSLVYQLTDAENGALNPLGLNCFRNFPIYGSVLWGSRTLNGADAEASEWKYIPVRRLALYLEESLFRGTKWVVFEPNDEPLWAQIRLNVGAFMHNLFRQGAFQGKTPREAYLVKCDKETTTQDDINRGIVNILVGFAPLKPAEFVFIKIQQLAGQIQA
jgi:phage tail sheath protein FI